MTRRARGFGAPSRIGVALLLVALAFAAAMMADGGGGVNPVFAQTTVDYDDDNDGLIDVRSLAQLDAIRHDLDGNGDPTAGAGATAYGIAFPNRVTTSSGRMGCPSGTCSGYELRAHLDFDTDGDGSTYAGTGDSAASDSGDAYHNSGNGWAPIGSGTSRFSATFKGNGFIISNLFIKRASTNWVGLFAALAGSARVESAGVHDGFVHGQNFVGILAGENKGTVAASWTTGAARGAAFIGGLVGYNVNFAAGDAGAVIACYSHASAHSTASSGNANMGGLVGTTQGVTGRPASLVASYSTGAVTAGTTSNVAALTLAVSPATITNSYYDSTTSVSSAGAGAGHATSALQTPTGYTGIYSAWNVNVDGTTGNDDPWDFGTASQYPVLKFGGMDPDLQRAGGDYDLDNDGLIEITTLAQLDAVRHDVDGNGDPTAGAGATAYNAAFPIRIKTAATRMGCPAGTCSGYELAAHLDFDTDGDGATYTGTGTSATGDSGDAAYYNGGAGWEPIGTAASQFSATFKGNGYVISNLFIKRTAATNVGLFGRASPTARFESVGLYNAYVYGNGRVGALVGRNAGSVAASYSTGWVRGGPGGVTGGLVGWLASIGGSGRITASYSTAAVSTHNTGFLGGLVGQMAAGTRVSASYSTGTVTTLAPSNVGAFVGGGVFTGGNPARVVASYWDSTTSGRADDADTNPPEGKTTADLKGETGYTGIYANWNVNVDGVSGADDPWDFGTSSQYPALKFGGMNPLYQHGDYDIDDDGLIDVSSLAQLDAVRHDLNGDGDPASAGSTAYAAAFPFREKSAGGRMGCPSGTCAGYELAADLDFDTDGDGSTYTGSGASAAGDSGDAYYNGGAGWEPIGSDPLAANRFATTFKGNGYIIHNLFIKRADTNNIGLFGSLHATARVESLGIANGYAYGNISVGLLVGVNRGTVAACWSGGAVRGKLREIGGLVGYNFAGVGTPNDAGDIIASYSTASAHSERATGQADVGGLAGATRGAAGNTANIIASYSTGAVTAASSTNVSGLTNLSGTASVSASFWDSTTSGIADDSDTATPEGEPTADLQTPTGYTGIFSTWNVNVDGVAGGDDPWDFGLGVDYPTLKYGGMDPWIQRGDYDRDNDGLIEIDTLAQLDAVRHDLNGNGDATNDSYAAAFPLRDTSSGTRMGCPLGACTGYELIADLDFDTDGDGSTYTGTGASAEGDPDDAYYNGGAGFDRIGNDSGSRFTSNFRGNGHIISNLFMKRPTTSDMGLFGALDGAARVESVGVKDAYVSGSSWTGILVGTCLGTVAASWSSGEVYGAARVGGLVGWLPTGRIIASYSHAATTATAVSNSAFIAGGLAGGINSTTPSDLVIASYSTGTVAATGAGQAAKVKGSTVVFGAATVTASYWDTTASGIPDDDDATMPEGLSTAELQAPTGYAGVFANWNVDVDGAAGADDPWDFGGPSAYPRLKYGGMDPDDQLFGDYDLDGDGLIEIRDLAQLDAVRHDLNGDGKNVAAGAPLTAYDAAFAERITASAALMGCPSGTCSGYELAADLNFDTDGDGVTYTGTGATATGDAGDAYYNGGAGWLPIGTSSARFSATFKGNGNIIYNLFIKRTSANQVGLFGALDGSARLESAGVADAYVYGNQYVGALVGENRGTVAASWSEGAVRGTLGVGGLIGRNLHGGPTTNDTAVTVASYSHASAHAIGASGIDNVGGLIGQMFGGSASIAASYSTGAVTSAVNANVGGLTNSGTITASYWDSTTSGIADDSGTAPPEGVATAGLQTVLDYTGVYANWNVNVDGVAGNDDPWDFGRAGEYPALKYGGMDPNKQRAALVDYDRDGDGLIEITTLAQLDAVRRDLDGDGAPASGGETAYDAAFPNRDAPIEGNMGCVGGTCSGYELAAHLDFDTNGNGATYTGTGTSAASDSGDAYHNGGNGWLPIGADTSATTRFNTTFKGNGYVISNLFIKRTTTDSVGLFGAVHTGARIESVGVRDAFVHGQTLVGALVGRLYGTVTTSWVSGEVLGTRWSGGFAGQLTGGTSGSITASYSRANFASSGSPGTEVGGLIGEATANTAVTASYSTGTVTSTGGNRGGLIGVANSSATITASYWDSTTTSITGTGAGAAQTTTALQGPAAYTGIFANWDVNVDGETGNDDPWHFGGTSAYPTLKFGGMDPYDQYGGDYDTDNDGLIEIWTLDRLNAVRWDLDGDAVQDTTTAADWKKYNAAFRGAAASLGCPDSDSDSNPGPCAGYELARDLDFDDGGYPNWTPIGGATAAFSGDFDGNNHKIANLKIAAPGASASIGLFGSASGDVLKTGLPNAQISVTGGNADTHVGALIGEKSGDALGNWSTGAITQTGGTGGDVGGLIGYSSAGRTGASWSSATVTTDAANARAGGLGGRIGGEALVAVYSTGAVTASGPRSYAGGVLGEMEPLTDDGFISAYVTGPVAKTGSCGGANPLYGLASGLTANAVAGLYWNAETTGYPDRPAIHQRGYDSNALQTPTAYANTIYATWNADIDGDATPDDPWVFGTTTVPAYPKLKWDGMSVTEQTITTTAIPAADTPPCAW